MSKNLLFNLKSPVLKEKEGRVRKKEKEIRESTVHAEKKENKHSLFDTSRGKSGNRAQSRTLKADERGSKQNTDYLTSLTVSLSSPSPSYCTPRRLLPFRVRLTGISNSTGNKPGIWKTTTALSMEAAFRLSTDVRTDGLIFLWLYTLRYHIEDIIVSNGRAKLLRLY